MKHILVICPLTRDHRELQLLKVSHKIIFHQFLPDDLRKLTKSEIKIQINILKQFIEQEAIDGLMSTADDLGILLKAIVAQQYNFPAPQPNIIAGQQHKYFARLAHQKLIPEATPAFALLQSGTSCPLPFPVFIKPVRSNFSQGSQTVNSLSALANAYREAYICSNEHPWFYLAEPYLPTYSNNIVLAEELCIGLQCTLEGFVFNNKLTLLGIIDSVMFPGTISFKRFDYPSVLPLLVQQRINMLTVRLIKGLGFDNGCFNIEFIYNPDKDIIHIIEMNPRLASQFADLYEKVDGFNSYEVLLFIAAGQMPDITFKKGKFLRAASCVLRTFKDHIIVKMPDKQIMHAIYAKYPEVRIELFGSVGQKLSELLQDGKSFRYGLIHVGGNDLADIESKCANIQEMLAIELKSV